MKSRMKVYKKRKNGLYKWAALSLVLVPLLCLTAMGDDSAQMVGHTGSGILGDKNENNLGFIDPIHEGNKAEYSVSEPLWTYDDGEIECNLVVYEGEKCRIDVMKGNVTVSSSKVGEGLTAWELHSTIGYSKPSNNDDFPKYDLYKVIVKSNAGVHSFELDDWKIEIDRIDANHITFVSGKCAYSDVRVVQSGERYIVTKTRWSSPKGTSGSIFHFNGPINNAVRIVCNDYLDLLFKGNYGTDNVNLRVVTDRIEGAAALFGNVDVKYYDFIGTPKFANPVTVRLDADESAFLYEYNKETGKATRITDYEYGSGAFNFTTRNLGTYLVTTSAPENNPDGILNINRSLTIDAGKRLNIRSGVPMRISSGTLRIGGTLTVGDTWTNESTVAISGSVTAEKGIQNNGGAVSMTGGTLTSSASGGTIQGDGILRLTGGTITNTGSGPALWLNTEPSSWDTTATLRSRSPYPVQVNGRSYVPDGYRIVQQSGYYTLVRE